MTIKEHVAKYGTQKTAIKLLEMRISCDFDCLPDTPQIWGIVERIEKPLKKGDWAKARQVMLAIPEKTILKLCF